LPATAASTCPKPGRSFRPSIAGFFGRPYWEVAVEVIRPFVGGEISDADLGRMANEAYATFRHPAVVPLARSAQSIRAGAVSRPDAGVQGRRDAADLAADGSRAGASARSAPPSWSRPRAIPAAPRSMRLRGGLDNVDLVVLFPHGRISDVQRRMMTTTGAGQRACARDRRHLRRLPGDREGPVQSSRLSRCGALSGVNSINWARIVAQVVYYFTSAVALGAPARKVDFTVPTGNFGDIFAGYVAKRMGLPVRWLRIAANVNDILPRTLKTGIYECARCTPRPRRRWTSRSPRISSGCCSRRAAATPPACAG
jgi:threonine synthase